MNRQDYTKFSQRLDMLNNRLSKKNKRADRKFYKTLMIVGKQELVTVLSDIDDLMKKTEKEEETKKLKAEIAKKKREKTKKDKEVQNAKAVLKKHGYME
jgi:histidyl-tRNA synthetase